MASCAQLQGAARHGYANAGGVDRAPRRIVRLTTRRRDKREHDPRKKGERGRVGSGSGGEGGKWGAGGGARTPRGEGGRAREGEGESPPPPPQPRPPTVRRLEMTVTYGVRCYERGAACRALLRREGPTFNFKVVFTALLPGLCHCRPSSRPGIRLASGGSARWQPWRHVAAAFIAARRNECSGLSLLALVVPQPQSTLCRAPSI